MSWRYQPVYCGTDDEPYVMLIEAYFDDNDRLERWSTDPIAPGGETVEDMCKDLNRMLVDGLCWVPVRMADLHVGMEFRKAVSMEERIALADHVQTTTGSMAAMRRDRMS